MEAKIVILGMSPRIPYLKNELTDCLSISFLYEDNIIKIEDLENYLNTKEPINISLTNNLDQIHFYLIRNGTHIIGFGEIPLINSIKWFNLIEFDNKKVNNNRLSSKILEEININNSNIQKTPSAYSSKNISIFQEIINSNNIKFKFSVEIINYNENTYSKINNLQKSISLKGEQDSNSNSISNTCTNSKTPKIMKNSSNNLLPKNNNTLLKNNNNYFKKIDIYSKNKNNNTALFSSINNRLLRNQTEKKLIQKNDTRGKILSFNDYYNINYKNNTEIGPTSPTDLTKINILNLTNFKKDNNNNKNKRKKIINAIEHFPNIDNININNSSKLLNDLNTKKNNILSNKKNKTKSKKKLNIKNKDLTRNFEKQNTKYTRNTLKEKLTLNEENKKINNNSFKKIEDVIIDQNFKNEIKKDELLGISSNNSSIISSFYSTKNNIFYNNTNPNQQNNFILDKDNDEIINANFIGNKNELFNVYNSEKIKLIKNDLLLDNLYSFIKKTIELENDYQNKYKELYCNYIKYKKFLELFQFLFLYISKKKKKLEYIELSSSEKKENNNIINQGFEYFKNSRKKIINYTEIPFWNQILYNNNTPFNNLNNNKNNRLKNNLTKIFLDICQKNQNNFNSLFKKCYNDIKNKYLQMQIQNNQLVKSNNKQYYSPTKDKNLSHNSSSLKIKNVSIKNNFYEMTPNENYMKTPNNKFNSKKSGDFKKEGLIMGKNKISSFFNNNNSKKGKKADIKKNKYK